MKRIGKLKTRKSVDIASSRIGIGFETLDRKMWDDTDEVYRLTGELGVKHARVQTGWCLCEQEVGVYDFAWLDRIVNKLLEQGVQPWFNVGYGNMLHTDARDLDGRGLGADLQRGIESGMVQVRRRPGGALSGPRHALRDLERAGHRRLLGERLQSA